jgi:hypothetical protein
MYTLRCAGRCDFECVRVKTGVWIRFVRLSRGVWQSLCAAENKSFSGNMACAALCSKPFPIPKVSEFWALETHRFSE